MTLLQTNPQDGPSSQALQFALLLLYFLVSLATTLTLYDLWPSIVHSILDLAFLYLFAVVILNSAKERIKQTFSAFLGTGIVVGVVNAIAFNVLIADRNVSTISVTDILVFLLIYAWTVLVYGHVVRHAIEVKLSAGIGVVLGYTLIVMILRQPLSTMLGI